ncbi:M28 family peptidase [Flavobacteriaceae bacterium GSB9]|nr:M28 family peptidase [Flavobacteriaceae bacterium GSB9]
MNKFLVLIGCLLLLACGSQKKTANVIGKTPEVIIPKMPETDMKSALEYLASDALKGRQTGTIGIEAAAKFIEYIFQKHNVQPYFKTYRDSFKVKKLNGYNVVGYLEGSDPELKNEFVVLGAHYDHIGVAKEVDGDKIANGANDDASGTVAVLEWAKYFSKTKNNKRSLLFTLYDAEEMGLKGSEHLADKLKNNGLNLYTMINFEMVGVPRAAGEAMAYITGFKMSNMAEKLNEYAQNKIVGFLPQAKQYNLFKRSDNYPFYNAFKIPAQAISTFDFTNFDYYHHVDDEVDKMDFKHMQDFINQMIPALEGMINAPTQEIQLNNE